MAKYPILIHDYFSDDERIFYHSSNQSFFSIVTNGIKDGESAFKCCNNIEVFFSSFYLRYPFWHDDNVDVHHSYFYETCRGPFWYSKNINCHDNSFLGDKAFRECQNVNIKKCNIKSNEVFWKCENLGIASSFIEGEYPFFNSDNVWLLDVTLKGKYSFQYVNKLIIEKGNLKTKDPFWHAKDVLIKNCIIDAEYVGWYASNLTFVNCRITSKQPFCYSTNLKFINCIFENCDLSFENSEVNGNIICQNVTIYNPKKGHLLLIGDYKIIEDKYYQGKDEFKIN